MVLDEQMWHNTSQAVLQLARWIVKKYNMALAKKRDLSDKLEELRSGGESHLEAEDLREEFAKQVEAGKKPLESESLKMYREGVN